MRLFKKPKPKLKPIDLSTLEAAKVHYFCKTSVIDRMRCRKAKIDFNEDVANTMEHKVRFYFVVTTDLEYNIVNGVIFEPWLKANKVQEKPQTRAAINCIHNYIKDL